MSRTYKDRSYHRKKVKNSFMQKICMCYCDDFGGTKKKDKTLNGLIRQRLKKGTMKEIEGDK
ncbi:MAG: hypothetical protein J6B89_03535 [Bacilli bacterium]|nr:hypothetical protein [Bacilli bacterium]